MNATGYILKWLLKPNYPSVACFYFTVDFKKGTSCILSERRVTIPRNKYSNLTCNWWLHTNDDPNTGEGL